MRRGQTVRYAPSKGQVALTLAMFSIFVLLVVGGIDLLPSLVPGLRYLYAPNAFTGPLPAVLVDFPLPISGLLATVLVLAPWAACVLPLISLLLLTIERTRVQSLTVHRTASLLVSEHRRQARQWGMIGLCLLSILALVAGFTSSNMAWAVDSHIGSGGDAQVILRRVAMVSATEGWAVGGIEASDDTNFGVIWHYAQDKWSRVPLTVTRNELYDLAVLPNGDAWAVGAGMTILHEHQGVWSMDPLPEGLGEAAYSFDSLFGITMVSPTEGWAVGGWAPTNEQYMLGSAPQHKSASTSFSSQPGSDPQRGSRLAFALASTAQFHTTSAELSISPADGPGWEQCLLLHYTGGRWLRVPCPAGDTLRALMSITVLPGGDVWAGGMENAILHEHHGTWTVASLFNRYDDTDGIRQIAMISPTEGWVIQFGSLYHYQNNKLSEVALPDAVAYNLNLHDVVMVSPTEGWAAGDGGLLHYTQGSWHLVTSHFIINYVQGPRGIAPVPGHPGDVWAVGNASGAPLILYGHNGTWSRYSS